MANEIRLRSNNISGAINDNPLLIGATTINSPQFADLPVVDATNHLIIILDPLEVYGAAEVVMVTAHTSLATSVTVVRGQEGSTARQHALGTVWFHGPVGSDWNYTQRTALSTNRPASPFNGELIYETDTNRWGARSSGGVWLPSPHNPPSCRVFNTGTQSLTNNTLTAITFDSERFDTDLMHSTSVNTSRITFNIPGVYLITGHVAVTGETDYTSVNVSIRLNGTTTIATTRLIFPSTTTFSADQPIFSVSSIYKVAAADYAELTVHQENVSANAETTVVSANNSPEFAACWIGVG